MKARFENGIIKVYPAIPVDWKNYLNFKEAGVAVWESEGFYDLVEPDINPELQKPGDLYFDIANNVFTREVIDKKIEELAAEKEALLQSIENRMDVKAMKRLLVILTRSILESPDVTQQELDDLSTIYSQYRIGAAYKTGDVFSHEGNLYKVVQDHTSQSDWVPGQVPALYSAYTPAGVIPDWIQPTGAQDAYPLGAKVKHNGQIWESTVDANVWEPGVYGWIAV